MIKDKSVFILGLGYVGCALAKSLEEDGWTVAGTCTNLRKMNRLRESGVDAHIFDGGSGRGDNDKSAMPLQDAGLAALMNATHVVSTIPPGQEGDGVLLGLSRQLRGSAMGAGRLKWLGYLSSTGVYGDQAGAWVDEATELRPGGSSTALRRAKAECEWQALYTRFGLPVHTFRLSGIYGPGRSALDTVRKCNGDMSSVGADDSVYISRVHVRDIVQVLRASMETPRPGLVVNVADDLPSSRYDVLAYAARLLRFPIQAPTRGGEYQSRGSSKRVDNTAMRGLLRACDQDMYYSDYRAGLKAIAAGMDEDPRVLFRDDVKEEEEKRHTGDVLSPYSSSDADADVVAIAAVAAAGSTDGAATVMRLEQRVVSLESDVKAMQAGLSKLAANCPGAGSD
jgi:nucleoside-diphosphate-sugar epimerase